MIFRSARKLATFGAPLLFAVGACSDIGSTEAQFADFSGFHAPNGLKIVLVENPNYQSDGIGYEANFRISGEEVQVKKFCLMINEKFFQNKSSTCQNYIGFVKAIGQNVTISTSIEYVDVSFSS